MTSAIFQSLGTTPVFEDSTKRYRPLNTPDSSVRVVFSSEDADGLSSLNEHLNLDQATITVVKEEPEEVLNTPMGESLHCEDYDGASTTPTHLEDVDKTCPVKQEPEEFAATLGMEGEGKTFEAFDSMPLLPVLLEGQRRDGSLCVIEVPDEILPTPTGGGFRSEDCNKVTCPQLDLEVHNNGCFVKQEPVDMAGESSDCGGSNSLSSSKERSDQECLDKQMKLPLNLLSNYKGTIYKCSTCTMAFTDEQHLNAHQAVHTG
ncbi:uncharacterized protein ISCGN_019790 [Ixodes scapularis]